MTNEALKVLSLNIEQIERMIEREKRDIERIQNRIDVLQKGLDQLERAKQVVFNDAAGIKPDTGF